MEPGFESTLPPFQNFAIFILFTTLQLSQPQYLAIDSKRNMLPICTVIAMWQSASQRISVGVETNGRTDGYCVI